MTDSPPTAVDPSLDSALFSQLEAVQPLVAAEFDIEESLIEHGVPTFYVRLRPDSKQAFTRLVRSLATVGFTPVLRERNGRLVLKAAQKPETKPSRPVINLVLFLVTVATVFVTGYFYSQGLVESALGYELDPFLGAASFTLALLGILGFHEMAHKLAASHHRMEATMPYFIPGPPSLPGFQFGIGTFGAVIVQKETAPNKDALFDIGASGPIAGFVLATVISAIGLALSPVRPLAEPIPGGITSFLFSFLLYALVEAPGPGMYVVYFHPLAFAGWIGMLVTFLNLLPTGMLDGGHTIRSFTNRESVRAIFTLASILILLATGNLLMLAFVVFLSFYRHPGPLDDVSKLSTGRKIMAVALILTFALSVMLPQNWVAEILRISGLL
jgi:membrane-associated protease RseP (regulator of RpoE activity)